MALNMFCQITELIVAIFATQIIVSFPREVVGFFLNGNFPADQYGQGKNQQTKRKKAWEGDKRRYHHNVIPVINTAQRTAVVAQEKRLKRAKDQNKYKIDHRINKRDNKSHIRRKHVQQMKR